MKGLKISLILLVILSAAVLPAGLWAQEPPAARPGEYGLPEARRDVRKLDLGQDEATAIRELLLKDARGLELARAEIREVQARVARLMLENKPDLDEIRKSVRLSLEAEFRIRIAQIERNLAIRALLGDERWSALSRLSRAYAALARSGNLKDLAERAGDAERLAPLVELLKALQ